MTRVRATLAASLAFALACGPRTPGLETTTEGATSSTLGPLVAGMREALDRRAGRARRAGVAEPCAAEAEDVPGVMCVPYVEVPDACAPPVGVCELP